VLARRIGPRRSILAGPLTIVVRKLALVPDIFFNGPAGPTVALRGPQSSGWLRASLLNAAGVVVPTNLRAPSAKTGSGEAFPPTTAEPGMSARA